MGKTFTEQYKFKRLLQTEPSVLRLYKEQKIAINSVPAVKDIAIYEHDEPYLVPSADPVSPNSSAKIIKLSRGSAEWPRRVEFAEQIPDLYKNDWDVWAVSLTVLASQAGVGDKTYNIKVRHIELPVVVTISHGRNISTEYNRVNDAALPKIDGNDRVFFYLHGLTNMKNNEDPWEVHMCGVCPHHVTPFNATFYDRDIAHLYADSLREEVTRVNSMYFGDK